MLTAKTSGNSVANRFAEFQENNIYYICNFFANQNPFTDDLSSKYCNFIGLIAVKRLNEVFRS